MTDYLSSLTEEQRKEMREARKLRVEQLKKEELQYMLGEFRK